jgi:hypothetical protein
LESLEPLVRSVMKTALLPPLSLGCWASKRFSSPC